MFNPLDHSTPETDKQILRKLAKQAMVTAKLQGRSPIAVEVGSWAGETALVLAPYFTQLYCVDHFLGNVGTRLDPAVTNLTDEKVFTVFCQNMGFKLLGTVFPCVGKSLTWAANWPSMVDFIFLDADHEYEGLKADIQAWTPYLRDGGIVCGHDYSEHFPGVKQAVSECFDYYDVAGNMWWVPPR
jgi:hypothetical protein